MTREKRVLMQIACYRFVRGTVSGDISVCVGRDYLYPLHRLYYAWLPAICHFSTIHRLMLTNVLNRRRKERRATKWILRETFVGLREKMKKSNKNTRTHRESQKQVKWTTEAAVLETKWEKEDENECVTKAEMIGYHLSKNLRKSFSRNVQSFSLARCAYMLIRREAFSLLWIFRWNACHWCGASKRICFDYSDSEHLNVQ